MQSILQPRNTWDELNSRLASFLQVDPLKTHIRVYKGVEHALTEVCLGLTQQFPHKKKAYYVSGMSPYTERPMKQLSMSGFDVVEKKLNVLDSAEDLKDELAREDLFFLFSEDDAVTGHKFNVADLEATVLEKKLFSVKIKHINTQEAFQAPERMQVHIYPISAGLCVVVSGARARIPDLVAGGMTWGSEDFEALQQSHFNNQVVENKPAVEKFESSQQLGARLLFDHQERVFDRTAIVFDDMDGHAFIHHLAEELGEPLRPVGIETRFECVSRSRWKDPKYFSWLIEQGLSAEDLRGLVVLSAELCSEASMPRLQKVREKVLKLQAGE